jgi:hypothetical protein
LLAHSREPPELSRFRVLSRIGVGASATVYRAHEASQDRIVALKVLHEDRLRDALVQCVVGLDQLHALGKVHRDIKPSNVRVTGGGRVVILDFGLLVDAHAGLGYEPSDGLGAGTAAYMAPEQAVGDPVSPATDLYAVGTMLYQALTGDLPFHGSAHDMRVAKVSSPAPDPRARGLTLPDDLARLCVELLAMQPGERPDARELLGRLGRSDQLRERPRRISLPPAHRMPFVGRASELMRLELLVTRPKADTECLHLVGGRGVGKTALMREAQKRAGQRANVLWLESCASPGQRAPYEGFGGIVEGLAAHLARQGVPAHMIVEGADTLHELFPALRRVAGLPHRLGPPLVPDRLERRWRALNALKHILACLAEERSVVIWIDDWDLADLDTVRVAERLFRGRGSPPLLVVLSSAPGDVALPLSERQVMVLGPLTPKESGDLGHTLTRGEALSEAEQAHIVAASHGHPLHLIELLRLTSESSWTGKILPASLDETLLARIAGLGEEARRLLELLALVDTPLHSELVQAALGRAPSDVSRALSELARAGFVLFDEASHGALAVAHGAISQVVRAATDSERTIELHQRITDALSGAELSLLPLLTRHGMAADHPELAADAAFRVSRAAAELLAMDRAATFHSLAAELTQQKDRLVQYQSARALAESLAEAGRSVEAAYAYQLAYQTSNAANALDLHRRSAELFVHSGHMEEAGLSCLRDALSTVGETLPETGRGALFSLLRQRAVLHLFGLGFEERTVQQVSARDLTRIDVLWSVGATLGLVDHVRGADFQARGLRYALRAGERSRVARALALEAAFSGSTEHPPGKRARQLLARAESIFGTRRDPYFEGLCSLGNAILDWASASHGAYVAHSLAAEDTLRAHCTDVLWEVTSSQQLIVAGLPWLGRFRELDERAQRYQQEALERGSQHVHASIELLGGYMRFLAGDDVKKARTRLKDAAALFPRERFLLQHLGEMMALLNVDQYEQRPLDEQRIRAARKAASESYLLRTNVARYLMLHAEARLSVELGSQQPREAARHADELTAIARAMAKLGTRIGLVEADLWHAHALALRGKLEGLPARLERVEQAAMELAPGLALAVRYRRGRLIKGDQGKALIAEVTRAFKAEGVRNVPRMINAFTPAPLGADRG